MSQFRHIHADQCNIMRHRHTNIYNEVSYCVFSFVINKHYDFRLVIIILLLILSRAFWRIPVCVFWSI